MDSPSLTIALAMLAGILAQAAARHLRIPGIVLLLATGVLLGPDVANVVRPESLDGGLLALVGFAVAVILFEGGLHMDVRRLRKQARAIRRLVTVGALVTAAGAAAAALLIMEWDLRLSILFGTLVIVTGPTVITPIVRRLRLNPNLATILEAEGIFIDAVGAIIAVVALEALLVPSRESLARGALDILLRLGVGGAIGAAGGLVLGLLIKRRHVIPEGLQNVVALAFAVAVFHVSHEIVHESGIPAAIAAGMVIAHIRSPAFGELVEFKEQLTVLLIAALFVLLAADVRIDEVLALGGPGLWTVAALMFLVRPLTVAISTFRTDLRWRDKLFLSWLAPRGIVAAAVASLFAIRLGEEGIAGGDQMRALVFLTIAITVTLQGITGGPVASLLGVRRKTNVGYLFLGANALARHLARPLQETGQPVILIDTNPDHCNVAAEQGFDVIYGNGLQERVLARGRADARIACVAVTPNESVNFLFAQRVRGDFPGPEIYVALESRTTGVTEDMVHRIAARVLFGAERQLGSWLRRVASDRVAYEEWTLDFPPEERGAMFGDAPAQVLLPLVIWRSGRALLVHDALRPQEGDLLDVAVALDQRKAAYDWLRNAGFVPASSEAPVGAG